MKIGVSIGMGVFITLGFLNTGCDGPRLIAPEDQTLLIEVVETSGDQSRPVPNAQIAIADATGAPQEVVATDAQGRVEAPIEPGYSATVLLPKVESRNQRQIRTYFGLTPNSTLRIVTNPHKPYLSGSQAVMQVSTAYPPSTSSYTVKVGACTASRSGAIGLQGIVVPLSHDCIQNDGRITAIAYAVNSVGAPLNFAVFRDVPLVNGIAEFRVDAWTPINSANSLETRTASFVNSPYFLSSAGFAWFAQRGGVFVPSNLVSGGIQSPLGLADARWSYLRDTRPKRHRYSFRGNFDGSIPALRKETKFWIEASDFANPFTLSLSLSASEGLGLVAPPETVTAFNDAPTPERPRIQWTAGNTNADYVVASISWQEGSFGELRTWLAFGPSGLREARLPAVTLPGLTSILPVASTEFYSPTVDLIDASWMEGYEDALLADAYLLSQEPEIANFPSDGAQILRRGRLVYQEN